MRAATSCARSSSATKSRRFVRMLSYAFAPSWFQHWFQATRSGERLDLLFDACAADASCNTAFGDLRADLKLELEGPQRIAVLEGLLDALGNTDGISKVPKLVAGAAHGDQALATNGLNARVQELQSFAWGMNAAVECQEEFLLLSAEQVAADAAAVRPGFQDLALRFPESSPALVPGCAEHNFTAVPSTTMTPVSSDAVPVLAISGRFDPCTPREWAERATAGFASRDLVTLENAGHDSALSSECPIGIVARSLLIRVERQIADAQVKLCISRCKLGPRTRLRRACIPAGAGTRPGRTRLTMV